MNPLSQVAQKARQLTTQDIVPPKPQSPQTSAGSPSTATTLKAEIVKDIPVKNPNEPPPPAQKPQKLPAMPVSKPFIEAVHEDEDKDLDKILRDVNNSFKLSEKTTDHKSKQSDTGKKNISQKLPAKQMRHRSSPILATVLACLVAIGLVISALVVFKNNS